MLGTLFLLFAQLAGALYMSTYMTQYAVAELLIIFVGLLGAITHYYAEYYMLPWNWKFGASWYALALVNLLFVFAFYNNYLLQGVSGVLALVGLVRCIGKQDNAHWEDAYYSSQFNPRLETYDLSGREQIVEADPMYVNIARDDWKDRATIVKATRKSTKKTTAKSASKSTTKRGRGRPKGSKDKKPRKKPKT